MPRTVRTTSNYQIAADTGTHEKSYQAIKKEIGPVKKKLAPLQKRENRIEELTLYFEQIN